MTICRRARQLPIQQQDEITRSETLATLASDNEYGEITFVAPLPSMRLLIRLISGAIRSADEHMVDGAND